MTTTQEHNVPALRFSEFAGEWEQKRLEDVLKIGSGRDYKHLDVGEIPVYGTGGYMTTVDKYLHDGESVCIGRKGTIDKPVYLNEKFWTVDTLFFTHSFNLSIPKFIYAIFQNINWKKHNEASGVPSLSKATIERIKIKIPAPLEQQKISSFLTSVDTKIERLGKRKVLLEKYKKGIMQKLFSQELRFKDEQGNDYPAWEEKKLGDVAVFSKGKGISKNDIDETGTIECIRYGQLYTDYAETIIDIKSKTNVPENELVLSYANDIIIPASGETQIDIATASCVLKSGVALGGDLNIIKTKQNGVFLSYYLNSVRKIDIARLSQGISVVHLYAAQLKLLHLSLPEIQEQQKIANFLSTLDQKIDLIATELKQAQIFKKGLLQQMFI